MARNVILTSTFVDGNRARVDGMKAIAPLLRREDVGEGWGLELVGTVFMIGRSGVFVTARHCLANRSADGTFTTIPGLMVCQFTERGTFQFRPVERINVHEVADVAVGALGFSFLPKGAPVRDTPCMRISFEEPSAGQQVATFAYPKTRWSLEGAHQKFEFAANHEAGRVIQFHPNGRDRVLLPGACYETSMKIAGGASGGPVTTRSGCAFAVNSTGFDVPDGHDPVSYITPLKEILDLGVSGVSFAGEPPQRYSIRELIDRKLIAVDGRVPAP